MQVDCNLFFHCIFCGFLCKNAIFQLRNLARKLFNRIFKVDNLYI